MMNNEEIFLSAVKRKTCFGSRIKGDTYHIGYGVDNKYVRCATTSMASICKNNRGKILVFHLLASDLSEENKRKISELSEILNVEINLYQLDQSVFLNLPTQVHLPSSIYYRYIFPLLLDVPRFLYLDADIVCLGDLSELFEMEFNDSFAAVVEDLAGLRKKRQKILGLTGDQYFNSGVLLMNMPVWREYKILEKALQLLVADPKKFRFPDQDALNVLLQGKVIYLNRRYNCLDASAKDDAEIRLLHFAAHPKPWNIAWPLSPLCTDFTRDLYRQYEQLTPFKDMPLEMPGNYKEMKIYAKCLWRSGQYAKSLLWQIKYIKNKFSV